MAYGEYPQAENAGTFGPIPAQAGIAPSQPVGGGMINLHEHLSAVHQQATGIRNRVYALMERLHGPQQTTSAMGENVKNIADGGSFSIALHTAQEAAGVLNDIQQLLDRIEEVV